MGNKRDFEEVGSPEQGSPEPQNSNGAAPFKKQKRQGMAKHRPNEGSSQWAKKRARNIERLLNRNQDLPANVRNELERELAAHQTTVSDKSFQKKRSAMISKYHMVRFFERKRAMRLAKQLRKKLGQSDSAEEAEKLKRQLHIVEVDEAYTQNFPHTETYISLYKVETANGDDEDKDAKTQALLAAERPAMWSVIEQAMMEGPASLRAVRERRTPDKSQEGGNKPPRRQQKPKPTTPPTKSAAKTEPKRQQKEKATPQATGESQVKMNRRERRRLMREAAPAAKNDDDDSDGGGFFEED